MVVGLLSIVIRISRRRAFNEVADALPGVTDRVTGVLPRQAGHAFDAIPIAHQLGFRLFERLAFGRAQVWLTGTEPGPFAAILGEAASWRVADGVAARL